MPRLRKKEIQLLTTLSISKLPTPEVFGLAILKVLGLQVAPILKYIITDAPIFPDHPGASALEYMELSQADDNHPPGGRPGAKTTRGQHRERAGFLRVSRVESLVGWAIPGLDPGPSSG